MSDTIFLHYTQAELDHNYDQRAWVSNADEIIARYISRSAEARGTLRCELDIAYGDGPDDRLDWFYTNASAAPVLLFIHAGAWRNFTKNDFSFVASPFVGAGCHVAVLNFSKAPAVRVPAILEQVRDGIVWAYRNLARFGADPSRLYIAGHSSGAYTTAIMVLTDWTRRGLPERNIFRKAFCISGSYDLKPIVLSARGSYIHLEGTEEDDLSPIRHVQHAATPALVAYCDGDTDEFKRHSNEFAAALDEHGMLLEKMVVPGRNHFDMIEAFADARTRLHAAVLGHIAAPA